MAGSAIWRIIRPGWVGLNYFQQGLNNFPQQELSASWLDMTGSNMYLWRLSTREPGNSQLESSRIWNYPVIQLVQRMKPFLCNLRVILLSLAGFHPGPILLIIISKLYYHETKPPPPLPWFQSIHLSEIILSFLPSAVKTGIPPLRI